MRVVQVAKVVVEIVVQVDVKICVRVNADMVVQMIAMVVVLGLVKDAPAVQVVLVHVLAVLELVGKVVLGLV